MQRGYNSKMPVGRRHAPAAPPPG